MRDIRFKQLTISDWRGQSRTVVFDKVTLIQGRNKSGKSTIWDSICWLFTGYDSLNRSNYQLFDNTIIPTKENSRPASVELVFEIDGMEYKIKKIAEMGWSRPRGKDYYEKKSSDDYRFEIDGVEVNASAYREFVETKFCSIEKLKFMLNTDYYLMLDWKELRKHFADIIGEVKKEDYEGDFIETFALIERYGGIDAAREYFKAQRKPMRDAIGDNNSKGTKIVELETLQSTLPDIGNIESAIAESEQIKKNILDIDAEMAGRAESIKPYIAKRNAELSEIAELESLQSAARIEYEGKQKESLREIEREIADIDAENRKIDRQNNDSMRQIADAKRGITSLQSRLTSYQKYREVLLEKNREVKARQFNEDKCPYCGQELPSDKLEELKAKFLSEREAEHNRIVADGKANNADIEKCKRDMEELQKIIDAGYNPIPHKDKSELDKKLADLRASFIPFEQTLEGQNKMTLIAEKRANMTQIPEVNNDDLQQKKKELYERQSELAETISNKKIYDSRMQRIQSLMEDIRNTANELAKVEGQLAKFDEIEKQKAEIIRRKVSALFALCEIEMEERKKDGTMTPCCNIIINGVKAQVTNTADKMLAGIDISNALCKFYGINMPLILDNAERMDNHSIMTAIQNGSDVRQMVILRVADTELEYGTFESIG